MLDGACWVTSGAAGLNSKGSYLGTSRLAACEAGCKPYPLNSGRPDFFWTKQMLGFLERGWIRATTFEGTLQGGLEGSLPGGGTKVRRA